MSGQVQAITIGIFSQAYPIRTEAGDRGCLWLLIAYAQVPTLCFFSSFSHFLLLSLYPTLLSSSFTLALTWFIALGRRATCLLTGPPIPLPGRGCPASQQAVECCFLPASEAASLPSVPLNLGVGCPQSGVRKFLLNVHPPACGRGLSGKAGHRITFGAIEILMLR